MHGKGNTFGRSGVGDGSLDFRLSIFFHHFGRNLQIRFRQSVQSRKVQTVVTTPIVIFRNYISGFIFQGQADKMNIAQSFTGLRSTQDIETPQGITEPPAEFDTEHTYITGIHFGEGNFVYTTASFIRLIDFLPVFRIVRYLYLISFSERSLPI